jgi:cyclopropane fatty-acyl-phospholipid synthase-like methyltransferase
MTDPYESTFRTWKQLAEVYHEKFKDITLYDASYERFCSLILNETPSILEIGCGPGNVTHWMKSRLPNSTILATDFAPEMLEVAKTVVNNVQFEVLDARNIHSLTSTFDAIMCAFCIPYLIKEDLNSFFEAASAKLNNSGIIYISSIDDDYENSQLRSNRPGPSMPVRYYRESDIVPLFETHEIEHLETIRINYPLPTGENQIHMILLGQKNKTP